MVKSKQSTPRRDIAPVHPNAAAIDIGATMHMAAVAETCDPEDHIMFDRKLIRSFATIIATCLSGCGIAVPEMQEFYEPKAQERVRENDVVNEVKCELNQGVQRALAAFSGNGPYAGKSVDWLNDWGAKVTLRISVDEKSALNPGVTFFRIFRNAVKTFPVGGNVTAGQNFSLGLGGSLSADATRTEIVDFTYGFKQLQQELGYNPCELRTGLFIESDLKIGDFIMNKAFIAAVPASVGPYQAAASKKSIGPFGTFSDEILFVVAYGGNVTPTWKFVDISGSTGSPFFNTSRSSTNDVTISLGPGKVENGFFVLNSQTQAIHSALLIGQATATSIQSQSSATSIPMFTSIPFTSIPMFQ
jgi:hypothetical protein